MTTWSQRLTVLLSVLAAACGSKGAHEIPLPPVTPDAQQSTVGAPVTTAWANGTASAQVTATVRSAAGVVLPGRQVAFAVTGAAGLSATSVATNVAGQATLTVTSTEVETTTVTAAVDGLGIGAPLELSFVAGPAAALRFAVEPEDTRAGELFAASVELMDERGRVVLEDGRDVILSLRGGAADGVLHGASSTTFQGGLATFADLWLDRASAGYALEAKAGALPGTSCASFDVAAAAADPAWSELRAPTPNVTAGDTASLVATVRDGFGNPVAGEQVWLSSSPAGAGDELTQPALPTDIDGHTTGALRATAAGVRGAAGALSGGRGMGVSAALSFAPGPPAAGPGRSTLVASPTTAAVDGTTIMATATLRDAFANPVPGAAVVLSASGDARCLSPGSQTSGTGQATGEVSSDTIGTQTISALVDGAVVASTEVTFTAPSLSGGLSRVSASPRFLVADGAAASQVRVTARFGSGRPAAGALVRLEHLGAGLVTPTSAVTGADGQATFQVSAADPTSGALRVTVGTGPAALVLRSAPRLTFAAPRALGGTVSGLTAGGLVLGSPGLPDLVLASGASTFAFAAALPGGAPYGVVVRRQPDGLSCTVVGGSGTASADVLGVQVRCAPPDWARVVATGDTTFAFKRDGTLWGWGLNNTGQVDGRAPWALPTPLAMGEGFAAVASGGSHTLALDADGVLWAWGDNASGQLGDGTTTRRATPVLVGVGFAQIAAGTSHSLAVAQDGGLWAWGDNASGQLGDGTITGRLAPVPIGAGFARIAAGDTHSLAVDAQGGLWGWGDNYYGQVGNGGSYAYSVPAPAAIGSGFAEVVAGGTQSAALKASGELWLWGSNLYGGLGDGSQTNRRQPYLLGTGFTSVALGNDHVAAVRSDHSLWAWGRNTYGQLGDGTRTNQLQPVQVTSQVAGVAAGFGHTVIVRLDGTLWTMGSNVSGGLGTGAMTALQPVPLQAVPGVGWASLAAGTDHTLAITEEGALWGWGQNEAGQLGDGGQVSRWQPAPVGTGFAQASAGDMHSVAVGLDGTLWTWGFNGYGQLGDPYTVVLRPIPAARGRGFMEAASGANHVVALRQDGTVWTLGLNTNGQLGDGTTAHSNVPLEVLAGSSDVAAGGDLSASLAADGALWGWGGTGVGTPTTRPAAAGANFLDVAVGGGHFVAIKADGTLWGWGANFQGQVGDGSGLQQPAPVQIGAGFVAVAAGDDYSLAIGADGSLWAWGANYSGQLGDGTRTDRPTPAKVASGVVAIAAGRGHSLAIRFDGSVIGWGRNYEGQLGTAPFSLVPVQVP
jgi:alpha-tubulin suppressor-like RCC1 family protein